VRGTPKQKYRETEKIEGGSGGGEGFCGPRGHPRRGIGRERRAVLLAVAGEDPHKRTRRENTGAAMRRVKIPDRRRGLQEIDKY